MKDPWTGRLVGKMHNNCITLEDLGKEAGITKAYVSMILNGERHPVGARERLEAALDRIIERRKNESHE